MKTDTDTKIGAGTWLPMGQRVLRGNYMSLNSDDIQNFLGAKEAGYFDQCVETTRLDEWMEPIPDTGLTLISEAREIGFDDMGVCRLKNDTKFTVVVAQWKDEYWLIARWA